MALKVKRMADVALKGKRVLIREDLNVPVKDGKVTSMARLNASLPTLKLALDARARHRHVASRAAEGRQAGSRRVACARRREAKRASRPPSAARRELARRRRRQTGRARALRERALQRRREGR